ncbi:VagC-like protein, putative plasmid maintenance protein [Escherichia coli]|uniref:VagC-like protein, putative plasmid maintenance protein n=1 Tax=Escherichia coli TaxID=562 RepID=A0A2X1KR57_ECOLX|nr:VagC-like protein, putative plasmid maintenance protein [Escherichia coli]
MRTVSIFKNGNNRAIHLPRDLDFEPGERAGDRPRRRQHHPASRPAELGSFAQLEKADPDFMAERENVVSDEGRFDL